MTTDNDVLARLLAAEADLLTHFKWTPYINQITHTVLWRDPSNNELVSQPVAVSRARMRMDRAAFPTLSEVRA